MDRAILLLGAVSGPVELALNRNIANRPLANLLKRRRVDLGLTQEDLARRSTISVRTIRELESGRARRPRAVSVRLLTDALGLAEVP